MIKQPILIPEKVANPTKPFGVARTLFKNKEKLIEFLENFEVRLKNFFFASITLVMSLDDRTAGPKLVHSPIIWYKVTGIRSGPWPEI